MSQIVYPGGQGTLTSTAQSPPSIETIFQNLVAQALGLPTVDSDGKPLPPGSAAWVDVKVGWQTYGQPSWKITEDVCIITAKPENPKFSQCRDMEHAANDSESLVQQMSYTQTWKIHFCFYGPNCFSRAGFIVSAMALDWVHNALAAFSIYEVTNNNRPVYAPENFDSQWWQRADVDLDFYELVNESLIVPAAASVGITIVKENNLNTTRNIDI